MAGSRKGTPNRNKQFLQNQLRILYGDDFDPILKAAENAVRMQAMADAAEKPPKDMDEADKILAKSGEFDMRKDCVSAWEKVAKYVTPQLKAIELTNPDGGALEITLIKRVIVEEKDK